MSSWIAPSVWMMVLGGTGVFAQEPNDRPARPPEVWAVVVGVDRYEDLAIPRARGAREDALAIRDWLIGPAGWDRRHVLLLIDGGRDRAPTEARAEVTAALMPTRTNLEWAVTRWLPARIRPGDVVLVYFAGQAALAPNPERERPGMPVLLPADGRAADLGNTAWKLDEGLDPIAAEGKNPVLCWLDTSLAGRGRSVTGDLNPQTLGPAARALLARLTRWPGSAAWLAGSTSTLPEPAPEARSAFVESLRQGLGTADRPANLLRCLDQLRRDANLADQGFRVLGGLTPGLSLWARQLQAEGVDVPELVLQRGHSDRITGVAATPDGSTLVTASMDSTIRVWKTADRTLLRVLPYHTIGATTLALSADGRLIVSGDGNGQIRIYDLLNAREVRLDGPSPHAARIESLIVLADSNHFVTLDQDQVVRLWDASGTSLRWSAPKDLSGPVQAVAAPASIGPDGATWVAATPEGTILRFSAEGQRLGRLEVPAGVGPLTALAVSPDGRRIASGSASGQLLVRKIEDRDSAPSRRDLGGPIEHLAFGPQDRLCAASGDAVQILDPDQPDQAPMVVPTGADLRAFALSSDGRFLAALRAGQDQPDVWSIRENEPRKLTSDPQGIAPARKGSPLVMSFMGTGESSTLAIGDSDGGVRLRNVGQGGQPAILNPSRGQVESLAAAPDGLSLLEITRDFEALVWDLGEGRGPRRLEGSWTSGAWLGGATPGLVLTSHPNGGGDLIRVDPATGLPRPEGPTFERPKAPRSEKPLPIAFGRVCASADGRIVAAAALAGQEPIACAWDAATGKLLGTYRGHDGPITAVALARDGRSLMTASEDGSAQLWDISANRQIGRFEPKLSEGDAPALTAAALDPNDPKRVVVGTQSGRVVIGKFEEGAAQRDLGTSEATVLALMFTRDGSYLAASGADKRVRAWEVKGAAPRRFNLEPLPNHDERIASLTAWPVGNLLVSGSDDTSIRFWDPVRRTLLGTLSATVGSGGVVDWVAYTPQGVFDANTGGETRVAWRLDEEVRPLESYYATYHRFALAGELARGIQPEAPPPPREQAPRLTIDDPEPIAPRREVELTISLNDLRNLSDLRLYQNGMPVAIRPVGGEELGFEAIPATRRLAVRLTLRHGVNRIYAMAGRPGAVDGRSGVVEVRFDGPDRAARVHVLALGVGQYRRNALKFAQADAREISRWIGETAGQTDPAARGRTEVLIDDEVTAEAVREALRRIRAETLSRPEDKVVVFLAGHTGIFDETQFCLLLPAFPFPDNAPKVVAMRGAVGAGGAGAKAPEQALPYRRIYADLARLDAHQRLVIVDACESEAIRDDAGVRRISELLESGSRTARTAYLFAARRGEPATESSVLEHGLFTYALLRGLGNPTIKRPAGLTIFDTHPTADLDRDRVITTAELQAYAERTLPPLTEQYAGLARSTENGPATNRSAPDREATRREIRVDAAEASFPLVELPNAPAGQP